MPPATHKAGSASPVPAHTISRIATPATRLMPAYHLAQVNVARAKAEMDTDVMRGFMDQLDAMNQLADQADGFIWRMLGSGGDYTSIRPYADPLVIMNVSLWRDVDSLKNYVYKTVHMDTIRARHAWFDKMNEIQLALWWVPAGHLPTAQEAKEKLDLVRRFGATQEAFTFAQVFPTPG